MCNFAKDDVFKLAKAILEDPVVYQDGDFTPYYYCLYCESELAGYDKRQWMFEHHPECPVLIAQDVLTRDL